MRVGLAYDLKESVAVDESAPEDALEEYDSRETLELIASSLVALGHSVAFLGGGREFLTNVLTASVDIVFNIAEGRGNLRSREAQVPSVLEMLDIPYSGSDPQCLAICLDKHTTKQLVGAAGIRTPQWRMVKHSLELGTMSWQGFRFPAIIKPVYEGSSKGVRLSSLVASPTELPEIVVQRLEHYRQPVMVEEFIDGDEVTVGLIGNDPPTVVGTMRVVPRQGNGRFIYSLEVKRDWKVLVDYECPAQFGQGVTDTIIAYSLKAFETLGCRDFARLDFRVSSDGRPYFLEINPLPGLGAHSDLVIMAIRMGWRHEELIGAVLKAAVLRYKPGIPWQGG